MGFPIFLWLVLIAIYSSLFAEYGTFAAGQCLGDQQSLLLSLKNGLIYEESLSTKLVNWSQGSSSWPGVTCEGGRVTGLDLSNESISDGINGSSSLFSLQYLKRLNLGFNRFNTSEIPSQIGNLSGLEYLNLSNAGLTGQIPIQLSSLRELTVLDLSTLYFPGTRSLKLEDPSLRSLVQDLSELRELYLDGVNISAPGAEWCGALSSSLPKLQVLSMSNCYLSGPLDPSLLSLKSLSVIRLGNNNLSTEVPDFFANFSNLTTLRLSTSGLSGMFPQRILQVQTLQNLDLSFNQFLRGSLPEFSAGSSLQTVVLSFTSFSGTLPDSIGYLSNLSRLELVNCSFNGTIPNSMMNLSRLFYLDFSFNKFGGPIPSFSNSRNLTQIILSHNNGLNGEINAIQWRYLQNLEILDLRYNSLQGSIPSGLFALPQIQKIQLSNNQFLGQVQLTESSDFSSSQLDTLDLSSNNLNGPVPTALFQFPELKYLSLSSNNFSGSLDINVVQQVSSLSYLDLSYNSLWIHASQNASETTLFPQMSTLKLASCHLKTLPGFLSNQSKLIYLELSDNEIGGVIPKWIWTLSNLLYLNLSSNHLENMETAIVPNLTSSLSILDLHSNRLRGKLPPLPPLATYVDYSSNNFSSVLPNDIGKDMSVMIFFSLSRNIFEGIVPDSICQAEYLQVLDLSKNSFTGRIPPCIVNAPLKVLNLRNNRLNGSVPEGFSRTCVLKTLDLSWNQLEGQVPHSLSNCTTLEVLDVGGNQMDGGFPCHLKNITDLRVLVMRENKFSGQIGCPENNCTWNQLQIVDLANNDFSILPPERCLSTWKAMQANDNNAEHLQSSFLELTGLYYQDTVTVTVKGLSLELTKILKLFTSIDLSGNSISGQIPNALGTFRSLRLLNVSRNELSGPIPPSLGSLQVLEALDLSRNFLTGSIPPELADLSFLSLLNLSYNQLVGKIPQGRQFDTFENSSYEGNVRLCGTPLTNDCTNNSAAEGGHKAPAPGVQFDWQFIITGLGFGSGAAAAVAPLTLSKTGRRWYDRRIDRFLLVFLPMLGFTYTIWGDQESEDGHGDDNGDEGEEGASQFHLEEEETWGRYCVFCSKLDHNMKKVIHDFNCTCHETPYNSSSSSSSYSSSSST